MAKSVRVPRDDWAVEVAGLLGRAIYLLNQHNAEVNRQYQGKNGDLDGASRVVDQSGQGWYLASNGDGGGFHWAASYGFNRGLSTFPDLPALQAARGLLRPVRPVTDEDTAALEAAFTTSGRKAVTTLCAALHEVLTSLAWAARAHGDPQPSVTARRWLLAGREGSNESEGLMALVLLGTDVKPSRVNPEARDAITAVVRQWVTGPYRFTEVADTLAFITARFAHAQGGWRTVADQWLQPGARASRDFRAAYWLLYKYAPDYNLDLL